MGMKLSDYAIANRNLAGKNKEPKKPREIKIRGKFCKGCGLKIKSAIITNLFCDGNFCTGCVKDIPNAH